MIYGIRRNCMNVWKKFYAGAGLNTNFWFKPGSQSTLVNGEKYILTQNGLNISGTFTGGGRFEGPVVYDFGSWKLDTTWYRGTTSGRVYLEWWENGGLPRRINFFGITN